MSAILADNARENETDEFMAELQERSNGACELCNSNSQLSIVEVPPLEEASPERALLTCAVCTEQLTGLDKLDANHWRCLHETIWSEVEAAQVTAWRLLQQLNSEPWSADLLDQLYLEDDSVEWAKALNPETEEDDAVITKDSNGIILSDGDTVSIIKDLDVKGTTFVAKRGTLVKNISLTGNPEHIEGRVNGVKLVLKTCFMKKAN